MAKRTTDFEDSIDAMRRDITALSRAVAQLGSEGSSFAKAISGSTGRLARKSRTEASEIKSHSIGLGRNAASIVGDAMRTGFELVKSEFRRNPVGTAVFTVGLGLLIGALRPR